jgi:hypothetical protein
MSKSRGRPRFHENGLGNLEMAVALASLHFQHVVSHPAEPSRRFASLAASTIPNRVARTRVMQDAAFEPA